MADAEGLPRFELGHITMTPGAKEVFEKSRDSWAIFLQRHHKGDWGNVDRENWAANDQAIKEGTRILSAYTLNDNTKIWIITEAIGPDNHRLSTCFLLPSSIKVRQ